MISIPLNLLRFILWPRIWWTLVHVSCVLDKNFFILLSSSGGLYNFGQVYRQVFQVSCLLLICCLLFDPLTERGILKSTVMMWTRKKFPFLFYQICFTYLEAQLLHAHAFGILKSSQKIDFSQCNILFTYDNIPCSEVCFIYY